MADKPINPIVDLSPDEASKILAHWLGEERKVHSVQRLTGGCVYTVVEITFEGDESPVVLKLCHRSAERGIAAEHEVLRHFRRHTDFPVPEPLACDVSGDVVPYSWLAMERIDGRNLGDAGGSLSEMDMLRLQLLMGNAVGRLHTHTRGAGFGRLVDEEPAPSWPTYFQGKIASEMRASWETGLMASEDLGPCERLVERIPELLARDTAPTLVHGDIWATNIMVAGEDDNLELSGFLDPGGLFADPEYELAYLEIWRTVDERFFDAYTNHHEVAEGYELRRLFYWLNTLLLHVRAFKTDDYASSATDLVRRLAQAL